MLRIGIVRGGQQQTFASSIAHGARVFAHLDTHEYERHDVLVTMDGEWHLDGMPRSPESIAQSLDVLYNALHETDPQNNVIDEIVSQYDMRVINATHRENHDFEKMHIHATQEGLY
jgi:D-alanine-D-alanine ligase-like ATP-grasp enzyme